ncbi:Thiamine pyrophosphate enzyme C-terminal TPP-binding [Penicillium malachiteum]|uniref:Thiamine pyrophosphate enzyme C-terminal TPP-binding n=1 Tax=Penicillium malachiteum TaxID=1324776 RepID=UPI0025465D45|nr:Thiamine pyrophosphate enzyme C-terminal TPP-binding [Penicillium malachiteum]KAJ5725280.1 Thiamine pyrophosphate enzyme C-terminal TPP-binding [Penicillium malachiteum]
MHLAEYLFRRLYQIDIRAVFGIPGDFNLKALDYIDDCGLNWIGNVNELNAGYAADGYARIKGISAIVTTFGVGELSAINAIAGACAELVPIIHIVGFPSALARENKLPIHHSLADGDFDLFMKMSERISSATILLDDPLEATKLIDDTIIQCYRSSKPVYIGFPMDMVQVDIDSSPLEHPLLLRLATSEFTNAEETAVKTIQNRVSQAQNPIIIVDSLASRYQNLEASRAFVENSSLPCFCYPMAKGIINESIPNFRGVYCGDVCRKEVQEQVKSSDLILLLGHRPTDLNNGGFQDDLPDVEKIVFQQDSVHIGETVHNNLHLENVLGKLSDIISESPSNSSPSSTPSGISSPPSSVASGEETLSFSLKESVQTMRDSTIDPTSAVTHDWLWKRVGSWLEENDILAMDVGTSSFGGLWCRYPRGVQPIFQLLWCSIGFAMGATVGAAIAAREQEQASENSLRRRTILFTGDGSLQMTAQEISTLVRQELSPIIFVICNDGYTIERYIHGWDKSYNDIQPWNYRLLPTVFNAKPGTMRTYSVRTKGELETLLADDQFGSAESFGEDNPEPLRLVEIHMDKHDAPQTIPDTIAGINGKK